MVPPGSLTLIRQHMGWSQCNRLYVEREQQMHLMYFSVGWRFYFIIASQFRLNLKHIGPRNTIKKKKKKTIR
jgi:hypothetical protein